MKAADFYAIVRRELGPWLKDCGFRRTGRDIGLALYPRAGLWIKPLPDPGPPPAPDRVIVSFEHSRWGWTPEIGGEFRVNLEIGQSAEFQTLLDETSRQQMLDLGHQIFDKILTRFPGSRHRCLAARDLIDNPRWHGFLPYYDEADTVAWTRLVRCWLPDLAWALTSDPTGAAHFHSAPDPVTESSSSGRSPGPPTGSVSAPDDESPTSGADPASA
ncbi:MAG: hypothetical protein QG622_3557 [Actinomycetota bacterium]|nr:hypothetical protein [Actinomycetota bacterium]